MTFTPGSRKLLVPGANPASRSAAIADAALRLRRAIDRVAPTSRDTAATARALSGRYRSAGPPPSLDDPSAATAYAASRMPATFAATARALAAAAERAVGFEPASLLDVAAGTGAAAWAACAVFPTIVHATLIDRARVALDLGRRLAAGSGDEVLASAAWRVAALPGELPRADLVSAGYVLGELAESDAAVLTDQLWAATSGVLVLVEPGSRAGFRRVVAARDRLLALGATVIAPCPGPAPCPVADSRGTWCHFIARLDRSPGHRRAKGATLSYEDEPFSYVALARPEVVADPRPRVVLGRPRHHPGRVELRVCVDGQIETTIVSRRAGEAWRTAKDLEWGDAITAEA